MATPKKDKGKKKGKGDSALAPDPKTLHTTDPQEKMEGPVSSVVQNVKEEVEENEERDKRDEKNK